MSKVYSTTIKTVVQNTEFGSESSSSSGDQAAVVKPPKAALGIGHISRRGGFAVVLPGGCILRSSRPGSVVTPPAAGARGIVRGLSSSSRRRLMRELMAIDWKSAPAYWVTLTYHEEWSPSWEGWKADLAAWRARLLRRYGGRLIGAVWRLEFQKRGAPHFHLAVFWKDQPPDITSFRRFAAKAWTEIVAHGDRAHRSHGTDVRSVRTGHGMGRLMTYLSKYLGKLEGSDVVDEDGEITSVPTGRVWGIWGELPRSVIGVIVLEDRQWWDTWSSLYDSSEYGGFVSRLPSYVYGRGLTLYGESGDLLGLLQGAGGVRYGGAVEVASTIDALLEELRDLN